jgi:hypothetical protein
MGRRRKNRAGLRSTQSWDELFGETEKEKPPAR